MKSYGLQSIEQKLSDFLKPIFQGSKKEFILINNLVKNWQEVVGVKYFNFCYPKSVNFNKDKSVGGKLTIAVYNSSVGFFLENNSELIIERIARFYGFKAISKIIIKQEPKTTNSVQTSEIKLPELEEKFLQERVSQITDPDLSKTLQKLGREILKK
ncbi:MAG: DUF721 domain-containing protein [Proteobacteria bacterium]|nr:DUF721 domain-containing protein [Pseudomonadota bacterium]